MSIRGASGAKPDCNSRIEFAHRPQGKSREGPRGIPPRARKSGKSRLVTALPGGLNSSATALRPCTVSAPNRNTVLIVRFTLLLILLAAPASALDRPVLSAGQAVPAGGGYRPDALTLKLRPDATRAALRGGAAPDFRAARTSLGLAGIDAVGASLGGATFARMFAGARPGTVASAEDEMLQGFFRVQLPAGVDLEDALGRFSSLAEVEKAEPIGVTPVSLMPDDSLFSVSTWFYQPSRHDIHAPEAWDVWPGDTSLVVAILDTGVIPYHPDLGGTIAGLRGQLWTNWAERGGLPGVDDDGNGFVDDFGGWDFVDAASGGPFPNAEDVDTEDNDPNDYAGHGTMVAGVIGAIGNNTIGVTGTVPQVRLMPLRVGWSTNAALGGQVDMGYVAEAIDYARRMGARVLNCSFATISTMPLEAAVTAATRAGVFIVFAAGNNGQVHDIQLREDVVSVSAVDGSDMVARFSNRGPEVDVAAPGVGILSTALIHAALDSIGERQPTYGQEDGTSFAAPLVSGGVALFESRRRSLGQRPLSPINLALRLWDTADDITALNPGDSLYGGGRLNLERLLLDPPVSHAHRAGSTSSGPCVVVHERSGTRLYWVSSNRRLLGSDAVTGDTLVNVALPGPPGRQLAAADLGGGHGVGLFIGTGNARMCGFDLTGQALPGWPFAAPSNFSQFIVGPAIGDLDGDGVLEIAAASGDGNVWAWSADGTLLSGFPVTTSTFGVAGAVALADVDGVPGEEIIVAARDGQVHALRHDGSEAPGWPVTVASAVPTVSPVIARFGSSAAILVAGGGWLHAYRGDGSLRWDAATGGTVVDDPALADFDGDGADEIVLPLNTPNQLAAFDSTGAPLSSRGWPRALWGPVSAPVVGPLAAGVPHGVLAMLNSALIALSDSARIMHTFPKPGGAGVGASLDDLDGDGRTEVAAGTGPDSLYYIYDAGAGSFSPGAPWPTPRGDYARTGSRVAPLALPVLDLTPPGTIANLSVDSLGATGARLAWSAPGGDGAIGRAARYDINVTPVAGEAGLFKPGYVRADGPAPGAAGAHDVYRLVALSPDTTLFVAVRAVDSTGNAGASSNVVRVSTQPPIVGPVAQLHLDRQPSRLPVGWHWQLAGEPAGVARDVFVYDVLGRRIARLPLPSGTEGTLQWNGQDHAGRVVPAGLYFARLVSGSLHAQSRVVLLP